jgi:7-carboxy-7-deazaguanine synthase
VTYSVKEIFLTLQGEGGRTGAKSLLCVRFGRLHLWNGRPEDRDKGKGACARWCDTDFAKGSPMTAGAILDEADRLWPAEDASLGVLTQRWLVITGGEPMLQLDEAFYDEANQRDWSVAAESNGSVKAAPVDWLTISPKLGAPLVQLTADELKVVLPGETGGEGWTDLELETLREAGDWARCYVQPQDPILQSAIGSTYLTKTLLGAKPEFDKNLKRCIDFVLAHPVWRLSFQTHKVEGLR